MLAGFYVVMGDAAMDCVSPWKFSPPSVDSNPKFVIIPYL